jgi:hypothetical protein
MALYSASVIDLDIVFCFLSLQEMRLQPRNTTKSHVDLLSSTLCAQSVSKKALTRVESDFQIFNPSLMNCFIYLNILLIAIQCTVVGECKNWQTLFTGNALSGQC